MLKKLLLLSFCLVGLTLSSHSQALTLDQLISYQKGGLSVINNSLVAKGWVFRGKTVTEDSDESEEVAEGEAKTENCGFTPVTWVFEPTGYDSNRALAFLNFSRNAECSDIVLYQTPSITALYNIKATIKKYGMELYDTSVAEIGDSGGVVESYVGANYIVKVITSSSENGSGKLTNDYYFIVIPKS